MEEKQYSVGEMTKDVPYLTVEGIQARNERVIHRLIRIIIFLIVGLILNNAMWIYFYNQYDYSDTTTETQTETVNVDSKDGGNANYIGNDGDITNGESDSYKNTDNNSNENPNTPNR